VLEPADRGDDDGVRSFDCARRVGCDRDGSEYQGFESLMTEPDSMPARSFSSDIGLAHPEVRRSHYDYVYIAGLRGHQQKSESALAKCFRDTLLFFSCLIAI